MDDDYDHEQEGLIYVVENIAGLNECSRNAQEMLDNFESQISACCECDNLCCETCHCVMNSKGTNYVYSEHKLLLHLDKLVSCFPIFECNSLCKCSNSCSNRLVQFGPVKDLIVKTCSSQIGLGLYTSKYIIKGQFVCEYAGEVITKEQACARHINNAKDNSMNYIFCLNEHSNGCIVQTIVDPSKFGNIGRYINHSCDPNCAILPVRVDSVVPKLAIFAIKDIAANAEITFDYGSQSKETVPLNSDKKYKKCLCNSTVCREWLPFDYY